MTGVTKWQDLAASQGFAAARRDALGTTAEIVVYPSPGLEAAEGEVDELLEALDLAANRFRSDSELSALNASGEASSLSPTLAVLIQVAIDAAGSTGGAVDPTVGRCLEEVGYDRDFSQLPTQLQARREPRAPAGSWRRIELSGGSVRIPQGVHLDLGATAKAWAADRAAALAESATGASVLISLGGDIASAGPPPPGGWTVRICDDHRDPLEAPGQTLELRSAGLATSSTVRRRWRQGAELVHHIVDPRSGSPAPGPWRTASVCADSCLAANCASTAAIVMGDDAPSWLLGRGLPGRLVTEAGRVLHLNGWPEEGDDLAPLLSAADRLMFG